jgi:hypothetical protein
VGTAGAVDPTVGVFPTGAVDPAVGVGTAGAFDPAVGIVPTGVGTTTGAVDPTVGVGIAGAVDLLGWLLRLESSCYLVEQSGLLEFAEQDSHLLE